MTILGIHDYWLFVATALVLVLVPGQDTMYIVGRSIGHGTRAGIASAFGVSTGIIVHSMAAAVGLSALLATSATAFLVLKFAGAAYLVYLGLRILLSQERIDNPVTSAGSPVPSPAYRQGVLMNMLNPKVAIFFLAFMPQFVSPDSGTRMIAFFVLGITLALLGAVWSLVLVVSAVRVRGVFGTGTRAHTILSRTAAGVFILLGLRLALSKPLTQAAIN